MKSFKNIFVLTMLITFLFTIFTISYATYTSPYTEPNYLVKYGSANEGVKWVQDLLKQNGYTVSIDGVFGNQTKTAILHFQKYNNLEQDGIVGQLTRNALKKSVSYVTNINNTNNNPNTNTNINNSSNNSTVITTPVNANKYTTANVNFRSGPSTQNYSYGIVEKCTSVYVLQTRSDNWAYVKYNNKYGYISSSYLSFDKPATISTNTTSNALPPFTRNSGNLINIIQNCKAYYASNNFYYSLANGVRSIPADKSVSYNQKYYTDCSNFVSWVLYEYAKANGNAAMQNYFSYQRNSATFASIGNAGGNTYLQKINSLNEAKEGDILVTDGHVEFLSSYTKNSNGSITFKVYNCGSDASIRNSGTSISITKYETEIKYILRVK